MHVTPPLNFKKWIDENRHLLKPPVGNSVVYQNTDFMIMIVGGPNSRKDYHVDPVKKFFYQNVPHSPQRFENTVGLVVEYKREEGALDTFQWYCDECDSLLHQVTLDLEDIVAQLPPLFEKYWDTMEYRTCNNCGAVQQPPNN